LGYASDSSAASSSPIAADDALMLTVLIPCLNEAQTLATCVTKAMAFLEEAGIPGEVLIADNGSTDGSQAIAESLGARVVEVATRGYGGALIGGIKAARGTYVIMADGDDSYDLRRLSSFFAELRGGADLVMGNRFRGGIEAGAMPFLHRYLGNPILSGIGRLLFRSPVRDFHCGLRGFKRASLLALNLKATGMEFASEMVVSASLNGLRIVEVPTTLKKDGRNRPPHLNTWRDGWRHLRFLLLHSPRWTFFYPGLALILFGLAVTGALLPGPLQITSRVSLDIHTFLAACVGMLLGTQSVTFGVLARRYAARQGLLPRSARYHRLIDGLTLETLLRAAGLLLLAGLGGALWAVYAWGETGFGALRHDFLLRFLILSMTAIATAVQLGFSAFLLGILDLPTGDARGRLAALQAALEPLGAAGAGSPRP
jgi:hypothetical protein